MKKPLIIATLGVVAVLMMGADDSGCSTEDTGPQATKQSGNGGNATIPKPASNEPEMTPGQANAVQAASDYMDYSSFSKSGLIDQLVYDQFSKRDAQFAANQMDVNWNQQAYQTAKDYLDYSSFSESGLVDQLIYDGFTQSQAEYGASKAYNGG
jgi:hypothetical protein